MLGTRGVVRKRHCDAWDLEICCDVRGASDDITPDHPPCARRPLRLRATPVASRPCPLRFGAVRRRPGRCRRPDGHRSGRRGLPHPGRPLPPRLRTHRPRTARPRRPGGAPGQGAAARPALRRSRPGRHGRADGDERPRRGHRAERAHRTGLVPTPGRARLRRRAPERWAARRDRPPAGLRAVPVSRWAGMSVRPDRRGGSPRRARPPGRVPGPRDSGCRSAARDCARTAPFRRPSR